MPFFLRCNKYREQIHWDVADDYFVIQKIKSNVRLKEAFYYEAFISTTGRRVELFTVITAYFINA